MMILPPVPVSWALEGHEGAEVTCEKVGSCGIVALNRPKALNALTLTMVREIAAALDGGRMTQGQLRHHPGMGDKAFVRAATSGFV